MIGLKGDNLSVKKFDNEDILHQIKLALSNKKTTKLDSVIESIPGEIDSVLNGEKKEETSKYSFELPNELLESVVKIANEIGEEPNTILYNLLDKSARELLVGSKTDIEIKKIIGDIEIPDLEGEVINFLKTHNTPFSKGTEAEVFKMNIPGKDKDVLLVKRKYENTIRNEYSKHLIMKNIENSIKSKMPNLVEIPTPIHHFDDGKNEYILMEFIKGKTFHLKIVEAILSQEYIKLGNKIEDEYLRKEFYYDYFKIVEKTSEEEDINFDKFISKDESEILKLISKKDGTLRDFTFEVDEEGNDSLLGLARILKQAGIQIGGNPDGEIDMGGGNVVNDLLHKKVNQADISKIGIFSSDQIKSIAKNLNDFIKHMHEKGLYHVDLGENARNIMFYQKDRDWIPVIIDFGRSRYYIDGKVNDDPYFDELRNIKFTRDENIINRILSMGTTNNLEKFKLIDNNKEKDLVNLFNSGEKIGATKTYIEPFYERYTKLKLKDSYSRITNILFSREDEGYKLNLSKSSLKDTNLIREDENNRLKSQILVLIYLLDDKDIQLLSSYIDSLDFKLTNRQLSKQQFYRDLYKDILNEVISIKK